MKSRLGAITLALSSLLSVSAASATTLNHHGSDFVAAWGFVQACLVYDSQGVSFNGYYNPSYISCSSYKGPEARWVEAPVVHNGPSAGTTEKIYVDTKGYNTSSTNPITCTVGSYDWQGNYLAGFSQTATCNKFNEFEFTLTSAQWSYWGYQNIRCLLPMETSCYVLGYDVVTS